MRVIRILFAVPWWFFFVANSALLAAFVLSPDFRETQTAARGIDPLVFVLFLVGQLMALLRVYIKG